MIGNEPNGYSNQPAFLPTEAGLQPCQKSASVEETQRPRDDRVQYGPCRTRIELRQNNRREIPHLDGDVDLRRRFPKTFQMVLEGRAPLGEVRFTELEPRSGIGHAM